MNAPARAARSARLSRRREDRQSLIVIRDLRFGERRHFRGLLTRSEERIASNVLADRLTRTLAGRDALLMPVAPTAAPKGLESTGDPSLCVPGSFSASRRSPFPSGLGAEGLLLSVQLIGNAFAEDRFLAAAGWCEATLAFEGAPPVSSAR